jgi:fatty acid/phospholipid biosynthesis enzyme
MPTQIAVDAMGGDHAPDVVVDGVAAALKSRPGDGVKLKSCMPFDNERISILSMRSASLEG